MLKHVVPYCSQSVRYSLRTFFKIIYTDNTTPTTDPKCWIKVYFLSIYMDMFLKVYQNHDFLWFQKVLKFSKSVPEQLMGRKWSYLTISLWKWIQTIFLVPKSYFEQVMRKNDIFARLLTIFRKLVLRY